MQRVSPLVMCLLMGLALGCQQKTPTAPASEPGKTPTWGQGFGAQAQPAPAMAPGMPTAEPTGPTGAAAAPAPAAGDLAARGLPSAPQESHGGGNMTGRIGPSGTDWSGGDVNTGRMAFGSLCARCHGQAGQGGQVADVGLVPSLASAEFQARVADAQIASVIAHGKGKMPSFMGELNGERLRGIVAYIRSLKK